MAPIITLLSEYMRHLRVNLITNFADRKGLWRSGTLLSALLSSWGHHPRAIQYDQPVQAQLADLNIFLETIRPALFPLAPRQWLIPNPEWFTEADALHLPAFERVLCQTRDAERLFSPLTDRAVYTGFESEDRYDPTVPRETNVLHVAGGSILKGTQAVLDAWEQYALPSPLTVVGDPQVVKPRPIRNVTYRGWVDDAELKRLQNSHLVHLQPSETEGWGHTIHEGLSVNAIVITITPLKTVGVAMGLPVRTNGARCLSTLYTVADVAHLCLAVALAVRRPLEASETPSPRDWFLAARERFRSRLKAMIDHIDRR
jgi:hypothetical protein